MDEHRRLQSEAVAADGRGHRALLDGHATAAREAFAGAARLYRASWDAAPPGSFGRLVGLMKATVLAAPDAGGPDPTAGRPVPDPAPPGPAQADAARPGHDPVPLGSEAEETARYVRDVIGPEPDSPTAAYALALASLVVADDVIARSAAALMRPGGNAFARAAEAIQALADRDAAAYAEALQAVVDDFAGRSEHLTGVPIADTAVVLDRFAARRGITARLDSPLLPR